MRENIIRRTTTHMRVLILGAGGMLGHKLYQQFQPRFDTWATVRSGYAAYQRYGLLHDDRIIGGVDAFNIDTVIRALGEIKPDVVVNCIGIIKQLRAAKDPIISLEINSLFPHRAANLAAAAGARFIHISTDCVFNGRKGGYTEDDPSDAEDLYGRSKFLGEVHEQPHALTLRTSIIGRELNSRAGLVEWFLSHRPGQPNFGQRVRGFRQAIYTGFTTQVMAHIIGDVIEHRPDLHGLYQVASEPINKYDLLLHVRDMYGMNVDIEPYDDFKMDRSLDGSRFEADAGFTPPSWQRMIQDMADDPTPYDQWKED
jgi:dTDP-4-dehydrorhamnose reductase